ncbi:MAG: beta-ketoacyl-ACP synthase II [bacterium]
MSKKRVVVTGLGTITAIGHDTKSYWDALINGRSGVKRIENFDTTDFPSQIGAQVLNIDYQGFLDKKEIKRNSRFISIGLMAAKEAIEDSGYSINENPENIGVDIGSGIGGIEILENSTLRLHQKGPNKVSPFTVPMMICDMAAGMIAIQFGAKGPNACAVTACASSAHSMGNAFQLIQHGKATAMITGGSEAAISPLGLSSFCAAKSLSTQHNNQPEKASRPFEKNRDGFVMGEGAGMLIFEELEHAKKRKAKIYAEIKGFGTTGDAYHLTAPAPEGEGAQRAMRQALKEANINAENIDYINAHGTSTILNDKNESIAIKKVLGNHAYKCAISSTKSMTGHLLGAAAAIELIASIQAINTGIIPPTINYEIPDPDCDLNYTANKAVKKDISYIMSNSFGFGGHNATIIAKKYQP